MLLLGLDKIPIANTNVNPVGPYTPVVIAVVATGINPIVLANATIDASIFLPSFNKFKEIGSQLLFPYLPHETNPPLILNK